MIDKPRISKITGKPVQKRTYKKKTGAPYGNKNNEKYPLEATLILFGAVLQILIKNPDIITDTELIFKCKYELSVSYRTYLYLRDEKYPVELVDIKKEIESILESRVMKSKEMYPGIAAMTLKNKHRWRDQQDLHIGMDEATLNTILATLPPEQAEKTKKALIAISAKKTKA